MSNVNDIEWWLENLENPEQKGQNNWMALCPSHKDINPSLAIKEQDGRVIVFCFAGCEYKEILEALEGQDMQDTNAMNTTVNLQLVGVEKQSWESYTGIDIEFWKKLGVFINDKEEVGFGWADGSTAIKYRKSGTKSFRWDSPEGKPIPSIWPKPEKRLPKTIIITEGEKDAGILRYCGYMAFTPTKGANYTPSVELINEFITAGSKEIILIFDNDNAGKKAEENWTQVILDTNAEVVVASLSEILNHSRGDKDIGDIFLAYNKDRDKLTKKIDGIIRSSRMASRVHSRSIQQIVESNNNEIEWLWQGVLAKGSVTLLSAPPKTGKSTIVRFLVDAICQGNEFLNIATKKSDVRILTEESEPAFIDKYEALRDIDEVRVNFITDFSANDSWTKIINELYWDIRKTKTELLIVDTISRWAQISKENDATEVNRAFLPLVRMAMKLKVSVLVLHHERKGQNDDNLSGVRGSTAFTANPDVIATYKASGEDTRELRVTSRFREKVPALYATLKDDVLTTTNPSESKAGETKDVLLTILEGAGEPQTLDMVTSQSGLSIKAAKSGLEYMVKTKQVVREGKGVRGSPYTYRKSGFAVDVNEK